MTILRSYPKILRLPVHMIDDPPEGFERPRGRRYMSIEHTDELLGYGTKYIEEKIDGSTEYNILERKNRKYQIFYEYMKWRHNIRYTALPSWKIALDMWDVNEEFWCGFAGLQWLNYMYGWNFIYIIDRVDETMLLEDLVKYLNRYSYYNPAHKIEGIVVKNYDCGLFGKIVNPEFEEEIDSSTHWSKRPREMNRLRLM